MRLWCALFIATAACTQPPTLAPVKFDGARSSLRVWAIDSASAPVTSLSGELRLGDRVIFASVQSVADTLLFQHIPPGTYELTIRRLGYHRKTSTARLVANESDSLVVTLQSQPSLMYDGVWPQAPWWKFWRR